MNAIFDISPMPNHSTIIGRKASGGMGRSSSIIGSIRFSSVRERPTSAPSNTPPTDARMKPWMTRDMLARMCVCSSPDAASLMPVCSTT